MIVVLLSGPIAVGKTRLRDALVRDFKSQYIKSSSYLKEVAAERAIEANRRGLQGLGDQLDAETDFRWIVDKVATPSFTTHASQERWLVDAVRKERQIEHFRNDYGRTALVYHVHLTAPEQVLRSRYEARGRDDSSLIEVSYDAACDHDNERAARALMYIADYVLDMTIASPEEGARLLWSKVEEASKLFRTDP